MQKKLIQSTNITIIYVILLLMNFIGAINEENESKDNNFNSENTFANKGKRKLEVENYIIIKYKENVEYPSGYKHYFRTNVNFIEYEGQRYTDSVVLTISANKELKVHILRDTTSLNLYFSKNNDINANKMISLDFSNFDPSLITNLNGLFSGCSSIESINFSNFITPKLEAMSQIFEGCSQLKSLNLSSFDTSKVTMMYNLFNGCTQLQSLDLSNFNTPVLKSTLSMFEGCTQLQSVRLSNLNTTQVFNINKMFKGCTNLEFLDIQNIVNVNDLTVSTISSMFDNVNNLKYINIYNAVSSGKLAEALSNELNAIDNLIVCQKNEIVTNDKAIYDCCTYNSDKSKCEFSNYMIIKYKEEVTYSNGFQIGSRTGIRFIEYGNKNYRYNEELIINANTEIKIYFSFDITSLESYFDNSIDSNVVNIISVDLTNFNSSLITNLNNMFKGCISITNINFSNFITSKVNTMTNIFYECSSLESIDLSNFDTSSVINMEYMFNGCSSLQSLILLNFDISKVENMDSMFNGCSNLKFLDISTFVGDSLTSSSTMFYNLNNLKYINIYDIASSGKLTEALSNELNAIDNLIVCQKNEIVTNDKAIYGCCTYNSDKSKCEFSNYMIIKYKEQATYSNGFQIGSRTGIRFIEYGNKNYRYNEELIINANTEIKIYFLFDITSLESYFDSSIDSNVVQIISIDLSNFNSSLITNLNNMFKGCTSITNINFSNFITSKVNTMINIFSECSSLESIDLSNFDTSSVINMEYMFNGCSSLQTLTLPINFVTSKVISINHMFYGCSILQSIDLSNFDSSSVINMEYMFYDCSALQSLELSNFDTSSVINMEYMFYDCSALQSLELSNFKTLLVKNMQYMFYGCYKLQTLTLSDDFVISEVENMNHMFYGCSILESIDLSNFDTLKVKKMEYMFYGCSALKSLELSNFDTSSVINMEYLFYGCSQLQSLDLSNFKTLLVKNMQYMFYGCNKLQTLKLSINFVTSEVENMNHMFYGCSLLESIDLLNFEILKVKKMEYMFYGCTSLQSLDLSSFDTSKVENMEYMFYGCSQLQSLDLSNFYTPLLQNSESMFEGCIQIISISLSNFKSSLINSMNNMFKECSNMKYLDINNCNDSPSVISSMFENVNNLQYINIYNISSNGNLARIISTELNNIANLFVCQKNGIIINPQDTYICCDYDITISKCQPSNYITLYFNKESHYENGFKNEFRYDIAFLDYNNKTIAGNTELNILADTHLEVCFNYPIINMTNFFSEKYDNNIINVISIDFSYFNSSLVNNMANMFFGCSTLESINFLNFDTLQVSNMSYMFFNCTSLSSINMSSFNTINVENMNSMFSGCISLESLNLFKFNTIKVKDMANMFSGCRSLKFINLFSFNTINVENMNSMFSGCSSLESLNLINFNTIKVKDMAKIFEGCRALKSIDLSNFETTNTENMNSMFSQCTSLKSLNLSNFDTSAVRSMDYMFYNCSSLSILDIANFNLLQSTVNQIFFGLINLSYINIYNIKDNNKIITSTLNTDTNIEKIFYVCQQELLITNGKSLDCCDYYENEAHCDFNNTDNRAITKEIMNAYSNIILTLEEKNYKVITTGNMVLQFSTYYEQLTNISEMVSSIDLGECEDKLREQEGLNETEKLLMIKLDIKNKTTNAISVQYEIFNPRNYSKVSLDVCKNITIKKIVPVILDQEKLSLISHVEQYGYNPFDLTDDFYNDVCSLYKAQNGADMVLSSRKTRIYDTVKDFYLCEEGCEFANLDTNMSKAECYCNIQTNETVTDVSKISFGKSEFVDNFYSTLYNSNFRVLKCFKLLFSSKGIKSNYGFYIMTFLLVLFIAFVIVHLKIGQTRIISIINSIIKSKGINENNNDIKDKKEEVEEEIKEEIILQNNMDKPETKDDLNADNVDIKIEDLQAPVKKRNLNEYQLKEEPIETQKAKIIYNTTDEMVNNLEEKYDKNEDKNEKIYKNSNNDKNENATKEQFRDLTDVEKNELDYEDAIFHDKRTFWQYYAFQLKRGHLIIFTFITTDDYNLRQIKILLFIVSFALYFTINAFFFGDDTMDQIYEDNAIFNFLFQLPQILYSSIVSSIIDIILKKLTISEEEILEMKKEKDMEKFIQKANKMKNSLKLKLIIFLALSSILMLFFWYFISCFCAVYGNTQHILIEDTFISFGTSMLYPFCLKLIPAVFRIPALRAPKKDKKYLYKISLLLNKFL